MLVAFVKQELLSKYCKNWGQVTTITTRYVHFNYFNPFYQKKIFLTKFENFVKVPLPRMMFLFLILIHLWHDYKKLFQANQKYSNPRPFIRFSCDCLLLKGVSDFFEFQGFLSSVAAENDFFRIFQPDLYESNPKSNFNSLHSLSTTIRLKPPMYTRNKNVVWATLQNAYPLPWCVSPLRMSAGWQPRCCIIVDAKNKTTLEKINTYYL